MFKITLVAPYRELMDLATEVFKEHNEYFCRKNSELSKNEYELDGIIAMNEEAASYRIDSDVIIARGYTADVLKGRKDYIPVVEIPVAGNDLIRSIFVCKKLYNAEKVAVIGSYNMVFGGEEIAKIMNMEIETFVLEDYNEAKSLVDLAKSKGHKVIVSGIGLGRYAKEIGLDSITIKTGKESLWQAITEAKRIAYISRTEQERSELFKNILDYSNEGVLAVNRRNKIFLANSAAQKILKIHEKNLIEREPDLALSSPGLTNLISSDAESFDEVINFKGSQIALNKVNMKVKGEETGKLLIFQEVLGLQEREGKIRNKISSRGLVAKHVFTDVVGKSEAVLNCIELAKSISRVNSNIIIIGETGTGKEIFSQSIHNYSLRSKGPFVAVNCAALPESLLESELFGYMEGAFTGALKGGKPGLFELAHRGTIFLDEIGEISPKLQSRLLRVLQEKEIMRIGGGRVIPVDVRIIAATNKDLKELMMKGQFREDLYYRLDVLKIKLPALRERREDIPLLADYFIKTHSMGLGKNNIIISKGAKELLKNLDYYGNVRELSNLCEKLVVLGRTDTIDEEVVKKIISMEGYEHERKKPAEISGEIKKPYKADDVPEIGGGRPGGEEGLLRQNRLNREIIEDALRETRYNRVKAAEYLGISRSSLYNYIRKLGIKL